MDSAGSGGQVLHNELNLEHVYILRCSNTKTYAGHTSNLEERLNRHHKGYVPSTKNLKPLHLLTFISFTDKYKAVTFEKYLKSGSGRAFLKKRLI